jgi:hypothetical protein
MNRVTIDNDVAKKLVEAGLRAEVRDTSGHILGYFHPVGPQPMTPELLQWAKDQISDEELDRRSANKDGITTEELLRRLDAL